MSNYTGLPQGATIIFATLAFAAFAWQAGIPREPEQKCNDITVVEYLPVPMPEPLVKSPPLGWPVEDRARPDDTPAAEPASIEQDSADEPPRRHRRHYRRRHR